MSIRTSILGHSSLFLGSLLLAACGGGGGGGGSGGGGGVGASGSTDMLVTDATVDELLAFQTSLQSIQWVDTAGGVGVNVLAAPVSLDLIGASVSPRWVSREAVPAGAYRGVRITLAAGSTQALDRLGASVAVSVIANSFELPFPAPVQVATGGYRQLMLDVDLASSLSGSVGAPPLVFDPTGSAALTSGGSSSSVIDEVKGVVQSLDANAQSLVIDAFADGDLSLPLGLVSVDVGATALLLDDNNVAFPSVPAFFSALTAGQTLLEVHGRLDAGSITATRIEIEDSIQGGGGGSHIVKIDGRIANLDTLANTFDLEIIEIEKGASIAVPVINGASSIPVVYTAQTSIVLEEHIPTTEASLASGQRVKVKFPAFANAPFPASQIEIEDQPEFEGRITSVAGLPNTITIRLSNSEPAVQSGQVQSSSTDVTVDLTQSTLYLDTKTKPSLAVTQLQPGLKIEVHGAISGPPSGPTIDARRTKIHAGRFRGQVLAVFPGLHSIDASMNDLKDPFGASVTFGNVAVNMALGAHFDGDADTETEFYALFAGLSGGDVLEVEVFGVGTVVNPNEILAYEIKAKVD